MESLPKTTFKAMHKRGELLLLGAAPQTKEEASSVVQAAIDIEALPSGKQTSPGAHGFIDDKHHRAYIDESQGVVYLERIEVGDDWKNYGNVKPRPSVVVYRVEA